MINFSRRMNPIRHGPGHRISDYFARSVAIKKFKFIEGSKLIPVPRYQLIYDNSSKTIDALHFKLVIDRRAVLIRFVIDQIWIGQVEMQQNLAAATNFRIQIGRASCREGV